MAHESARVRCGIGGWLALLWFGLTIGTPVSLVLGSFSVITVNQTPGSLITFNQHPYAIALGIVDLLLAVFSFTSGIKLRHTARPARIFLTAIIVFNLAVGAAFSLLRDPAALAQLVVGSAVSAAWIAYLNRSVRVRNTYPAEFRLDPATRCASV